MSVQVVYYSDKYHDRWEWVAARRMFDLSGVTYIQHTPAKRRVVIDFDAVNRMPGVGGEADDDEQRSYTDTDDDEDARVGGNAGSAEDVPPS
jgi:hypothetical protein